MALSFEKKREILRSFTGLNEIFISEEGYNYSYSGKRGKKKDIVLELSPHSCGYIYVKGLHPINYLGNADGYASLDYFEEEDLRFLIEQIIELSNS